MHDCHNCGQACYCDGDDTALATPDDCSHECQELGDDFNEWDVLDDYPAAPVETRPSASHGERRRFLLDGSARV